MTDRIIDIFWDGPFVLSGGRADLRQIGECNRETDYGVYQVYAHHQVYGRSLVYIGKAFGQTFAQRIRQHLWDSGSEPDPRSVEIYVGRLGGITGATPDEWRRDTDGAEKLLIHAHAPAYNSNYIKDPPSTAECGGLRVLNWGAARSLQREVSGLMWTGAAAQRLKATPYSRADTSLSADVT